MRLWEGIALLRLPWRACPGSSASLGGFLHLFLKFSALTNEFTLNQWKLKTFPFLHICFLICLLYLSLHIQVPIWMSQSISPQNSSPWNEGRAHGKERKEQQWWLTWHSPEELQTWQEDFCVGWCGTHGGDLPIQSWFMLVMDHQDPEGNKVRSGPKWSLPQFCNVDFG